MSRRLRLVVLSVSLLLALVIAPSVFADPNAVRTAGSLNVSLSYSPNPVQQYASTTGSYSIVGGTPPFTIWQNNTPAGCQPQSNPMTTSNPSGTFSCTPNVSGTFNVHVDVQDSAGDTGSTQVTLTVNSGNSGGSSSSGGNSTGGIDLSFLQNLLPVVMITGVLFLGSVVAIAVSAVALAVLVPRRLKQIRKALEAQTSRPAHAESPTSPPPPPKEQPPGD